MFIKLILICMVTTSISQNHFTSQRNIELQKLNNRSLLKYSSSLNTGNCPTEYCKCIRHLRYATCKGHRKRLPFIPKIPNSTRVLYFYNNYLPCLNRKTFSNITSTLEEMRLRSNSVSQITSDAFIDLKYLKIIDLSDNPKLDTVSLVSSFKGLSDAISELYMINIGWKIFSADMFLPLNSKNVTKIVLRDNNIHVLNGSVFKPLGTLRQLDVSYNGIKYYNFRGLSRLVELKLQGNYLQYPPKFCDYNNLNALIPNLEILNLGNNGIQYLHQNSFICLNNLRILILDTNPIRWKLRNNIFSPLYSLERLSISNIGSNVKRIERYAFNNSNLRELRFAYNSFHFDFLKRFHPAYIFKSSQMLEKLELSESYFPSDYRIFHKMFFPLKKLKILILQSSNITTLPQHFFPNFHFLKKLVLARNRISSWNGSNVFGNMTSLKSLYLNNNLISIINKTSFPEQFLSSLEILSLDRNPLSCTCNNLWFRNWIRMKKTEINLKGYPNRYVCSSPPELSFNKTLFRDYNPTEESCAERNILITIIVIVSVLVLVPTISVILMYKCRWHIRYKFYLMRKKGYEKLPNDEDCVYNGFVVYSDTDRYWVHNEMLKTLEEHEGFRLCIRHRDFECGKVYVDNIVENMNVSRKIILVLSNNFVDDEWCNFQMLLAQQRLVKEGSGELILVMLHEIDYKNLTSSMHSLVTTTTYSAWT